MPGAHTGPVAGPSCSLCACVTLGPPSVGTGLGASKHKGRGGAGSAAAEPLPVCPYVCGWPSGWREGLQARDKAWRGLPGRPLVCTLGLGAEGTVPGLPSSPHPGCPLPGADISDIQASTHGHRLPPTTAEGDRRDSKNRRYAWPRQGFVWRLFFFNSNFFDKIFSHGRRHWERPLGRHSRWTIPGPDHQLQGSRPRPPRETHCPSPTRL